MQKGIDHIGVSVSYFCHDGKGRYLMNKRSINCRDEHGCWDFGGGGIEHGDTIEDTLRKEIKEEYCTDVLSFKLLGPTESFREFNGHKSHWIHLHFLAEIDGDKVKNGEPHKFDEIGWFTLNNLPSPLHSQTSGDLKRFWDELPFNS
jgi:ADP-ribose pyrophosphatase YjhB (NUDIX family)